MTHESPYEYNDQQLGVKIKYLTKDRNPHPRSLRLVSYRTLKARMDSPRRPETQLRKGGNYHEALIAFESLPEFWKELLIETFGKPQKPTRSFFDKYYQYDVDAFNFFMSYRFGKDNSKKLPEEAIKQYTADASVLNTLLIVKEHRKAYIRTLGSVKVDIWQSLSNDVNAFRKVPHNLPANKDALRKKANEYKGKNYISLISKKYNNLNAVKVKQKEQLALIDTLLLKHQNFDYSFIADIYNSVAAQVGWSPVTAQTIANRAQKKKLVIYAGRNGVKELKNKQLMQVKRSRPTSPMLYWTIDGWDVELYYQKTTQNSKGNKVTTYTNRMTIVVVLDTYNNYPVGFAIDQHENTGVIKRALQNAMNHVKELFGKYYIPYQIQSDNYGKKALTPIYKALSVHYTPVEVGNAKAKVIEPYFKQLNKKYCQKLPNWSGFGIATGSKKQPNVEYLQKIRHSFPDTAENIRQIEAIIQAERIAKQKKYISAFKSAPDSHKKQLTEEAYLYLFGETNNRTVQLRGEGIIKTINGQEYTFDSFNPEFRKVPVSDWQIYYDTSNLNQVLAVSPDGAYRFLLEQKHIQPMALVERSEGDSEALQRVRNYNKELIQDIKEEIKETSDIVMEFFEQNPALQNSLAKHLLTDSHGQHKDHKSAARLQAAKQAAHIAGKQVKEQAKTKAQEQLDYYAQKVDINEFINP